MMARIRSIHPGLFTDEAFMSASANARLLLIGLWCEAFDDGAFEVKPLTLKARIFPVDAVNVEELLAELERLGWFRTFSARGRMWGALRNFRRYQRPKKPNNSGVFPPEMVQFVTGSEAMPDNADTGTEPVPPKSATPLPMEDGGGNRIDNPASLSSTIRGAVADAKRVEPMPDGPDDDFRRTERACIEALGGTRPRAD